MKRLFVVSFLSLALIACHKEQSIPLPPDRASMISPLKDEICTTGSMISTTESKVTFKWVAAPNADQYQLVVKDLLSGVEQTESSGGTSIEVRLLMNTPYSWKVISKSAQNNLTAESELWKFYNSGPGIIHYAPFPASIIAPTAGQSITAVQSSINLSWNGSDPDGDVQNYDIYFSEATTPTLYLARITDTTLAGVPVKSGTTYYWRIITRDAQGNTSDSGVSQFKVN